MYSIDIEEVQKLAYALTLPGEPLDFQFAAEVLGAYPREAEQIDQQLTERNTRARDEYRI